MDEATSHLDVETERVINRTLRALPVTRIMVAHRPETIAFADHVIEIAHGTARVRRQTSAASGVAEA